jgi:hypothetical protein
MSVHPGMLTETEIVGKAKEEGMKELYCHIDDDKLATSFSKIREF